MIRKFAGATLAASVLSAQPCAAASDFGGRSDLSRPTAFGGISLRMPLGTNAPARPQARLTLTTYRYNPSQPAAMRTFNPNGLEFGASRSGKPLLFVGGQRLAEAERKLGLGTTNTILIAGGVLVALVVVAVAAGGGGIGDTCPEIDGSRDHCIDP